MAKVGLISLGCSKNRVDSELMLAILRDAGHTLTADERKAEILIVNTCGFIDPAKQESIDNILDAAELKRYKCKHVIATGCLVERYREEVLRELPEVDAIVGVGSLDRIVDAVRAVERGERFSALLDPNTSPLGGDRVLTTPEHMAYLKIAEGCDNRCTYCAIPLIRGGFRSREMEDVLKEYVKSRLSNADNIQTNRIFVTHTDMDPKLVDLVIKTVNETLKFDSVLHTSAGSTISVHCGPGTLGILFARKNPIS